MKKLWRVLILSVVFILPECSAMKNMTKFFNKNVAFRLHKKQIRRNNLDIQKWEPEAIYGAGLFLGGLTSILYVTSNSVFSFKTGSFDAVNDEDVKLKRFDPFKWAVLMTLPVELIVGLTRGPILIYSLFQAACYGAGYASVRRKYDEKKRLTENKKLK